METALAELGLAVVDSLLLHGPPHGSCATPASCGAAQAQCGVPRSSDLGTSGGEGSSHAGYMGRWQPSPQQIIEELQGLHSEDQGRGLLIAGDNLEPIFMTYQLD